MELFKVTLELGNEEMQHFEHVADALERIARFVRQGIMINSTESVRDVNGNTVGSFIWERR